MAEYVKREEVIEAKEGLFFINGRYSDVVAVDTIRNIPAADVVEVVRCKDCKHRRNDEDYARGHYCVKRPSNGGYFCEDEDFCSYGERRESDV